MKRTISLIVLFLLLCVSIGTFLWDSHIQNSDQELYDLLVKVLQNGGGFGVASNDPDTDYKHLGHGDRILPEYINSIDNLGVRNLVITQNEMIWFANLKNLEFLMFVECEFNEDVFAPLENSMIRELYVKQSVMPGISGRSISKLKKLETLGLTQSDFPDEFYKNCGALNINTLGIYEVSVRAKNLKDMLPLPNLSMLLLYDTDIEDDITGFLNELPNLKTICIYNASKLRCEFIRDMTNSDNIEKIEIGNTDIDDEILFAITHFKNLKSLIISGNKITEDSIPVMETFAKEERYIVLRDGDGEILYCSDPVYPIFIPSPENSSTDDQIDEK